MTFSPASFSHERVVVLSLGLVLSTFLSVARARPRFPDEPPIAPEALAQCEKRIPRYRDEWLLIWGKRLVARGELTCLVRAFQNSYFSDDELCLLLNSGLPEGRWEKIDWQAVGLRDLAPPEKIIVARALRDPAALPFLKEILGEGPQWRTLSFQALGALRPTPELLNFLREQILSPDPELRLDAALALAEMGKIKEALPALERSLFSPESTLRGRARAALKEIPSWRGNPLLDFVLWMEMPTGMAAAIAQHADAIVAYFLRLGLEERHAAGERFCQKHVNFTYPQLMRFDEALEKLARSASSEDKERIRNWREAIRQDMTLSPVQNAAATDLLQKLESDTYSVRRDAAREFRQLFNVTGFKIYSRLYQAAQTSPEIQIFAAPYFEGASFDFPVGLTNYFCPYSPERALRPRPPDLLE